VRPSDTSPIPVEARSGSANEMPLWTLAGASSSRSPLAFFPKSTRWAATSMRGRLHLLQSDEGLLTGQRRRDRPASEAGSDWAGATRLAAASASAATALDRTFGFAPVSEP
jgi:hypothetical protein